MNMKIVGISIAAVIGIIVLGSVLMPILNDATATTDKFTNEGIINTKVLDENTSTIIVWDYETPNILNVDGEDMDLSNVPSTYGALTFVFSNDWFVRLTSINTGASLNVFKCGTNSGASVLTVNDATVTITIGSGSATIVSGETTLNYTVANDGLVITPNKSDYVVKFASDTAYVNEDSVVYGAGRTDRALGTSGTSFNVIFKASIEDGFTPLSYAPQYIFSDNYTMNYTESTNHEDLYSLSGVTFNLTASSVDHPITYNQIFVPTEVSAERSVHFTDGQNAILGAIPIMIIVAILLGVIALVVRSRLE